MHLKNIISFFCLLSLSLSVLAQQPVKVDTLIKKLDSLARKTDSAGKQINNINEGAYNDITKLNVRSYFILLGSDLKQEFTKPFHMTRRDWGKFAKFAVVAVAMGFADEPIQRNALNLRNRSNTVRSVGHQITSFGGLYEAYTLAAFGAYGVIFKNDKVKTTTLLATQAVITGFITEAVIKTIAGRTRPNYYDQFTEPEPKFLGPFGKTGKDVTGARSNSSFPSGHTTAAFAAATVFAVEYRNQPVIPIVAYTIASLVGISRVTENKHWATDVFTGAALGYLTGRQVSLNYHRYAKLKNAAAKKSSVTFNLQSHYGKMMPGLLWKFG